MVVCGGISIDAICPTQGHAAKYPGSLYVSEQLKCCQKENYNVEDDEPEAWTTELYNTYLQK